MTTKGQQRGVAAVVLALGALFGSAVPTEGATAAAGTWTCPPAGSTLCASASISITTPPRGPSIRATVTPTSTPLGDCWYLGDDLTVAAVRRAMTPWSSLCRVITPSPSAVPMTQPAQAWRGLQRAWSQYWSTRSHARPVVLVGFGHGASLLARLVRVVINQHPTQRASLAQAQLYEAALPLATPRSPFDALGGLPLCRFRNDVHCAIVANLFHHPPTTSPLLATTVHDPWLGPVTGDHSGCVNPVYVNQADGPLINAFGSGPFTTYPNRFRAYCSQRGTRSWLSVTQVSDFGPRAGRNVRPTLPDDTRNPNGLLASSWSFIGGSALAAARSALVSLSIHK